MSLKRQRHHQPTPFQLKKEIRRGEISEKGKGVGWWFAYCWSSRGGAALVGIADALCAFVLKVCYRYPSYNIFFTSVISFSFFLSFIYKYKEERLTPIKLP